MADDTPPDRPCPQIDTAVPQSARIWNYWLGGKDNYAADRAAGDAYAKVFPAITHIARSSRYFLARAVAYLAAEAGIRQFLDVGTGLPTVDNTHEVAQRIAPDARIVYVDNDPLVLAHARALLTGSSQGRCEYIDADVREPGKLLHAAGRLLDFGAPVALLLMGIMGHLGDEHAHPVAAELVAGLPAGSYLALYDGSDVSAAFNAAQDAYNQTGAAPYFLRSPAQIAAFFDGLDLIHPGVVPCTRWRPDPTPFGPPAEAETYGGLGHKPTATSTGQ